MINESEFKTDILKVLNQYEAGWVDGDTEKQKGKTVDLVNHKLKIAIEIKDDTKHSLISNSKVNANDLNIMNMRYGDHIKSANSKFKNYLNYKTVILFRFSNLPDIVKYVIEGLVQIVFSKEDISYQRRVGKYTKYAKNEVGGFLLHNEININGNNIWYFTNYLAKDERKLDKFEIKKITGWNIIDI